MLILTIYLIGFFFGVFVTLLTKNTIHVMALTLLNVLLVGGIINIEMTLGTCIWFVVSALFGHVAVTEKIIFKPSG